MDFVRLRVGRWVGRARWESNVTVWRRGSGLGVGTGVWGGELE